MTKYLTDFPEASNLRDKVIISFATSQKLSSDFARREISTCNPYYTLFRIFFYLTRSRYVHCEISFQKYNDLDKLISFTSTAQSGVTCIERDFDTEYKHIGLQTTAENKRIMYDFLRSQVGLNFDKDGSLRMPYWSGQWERKKKWYCISLVIETLKIGYLLPNIRSNCYSVDELYDILIEHDSLRTEIVPRLIRDRLV